jgi:hypothetical protein
VSIWHAPQRARPHYPLAHHVTMSDLAIFAVGMFVAVMVGIAASGMLPL